MFFEPYFYIVHGRCNRTQAVGRSIGRVRKTRNLSARGTLNVGPPGGMVDMANDSDVTVATGNSRHYQPLCRIARRHRRKSSNLLFSTFFHASRSFWSHRTILPFTLFLSIYLPLFYTFLLSQISFFLFTARYNNEKGLGPFPPPKKEVRKGGRRWPEARKESRCPDNPDLSGQHPLAFPLYRLLRAFSMV